MDRALSPIVTQLQLLFTWLVSWFQSPAYRDTEVLGG